MHPIAVDHKLETIVAYLAKKGCKKIMLFGSYAEETFREDSDIDIAVTGMSGKDFFTAIASLPMLVQHKVDLVDLDDLPEAFRKIVEEKGVTIYGN